MRESIPPTIAVLTNKRNYPHQSLASFIFFLQDKTACNNPADYTMKQVSPLIWAVGSSIEHASIISHNWCVWFFLNLARMSTSVS